ncbi:MAG: hypothetical protein K0Q94_275 [Paenibacillus sp.]|jgi:hypothetical protein|uniref:DUF5957 family protein n=1 Tax=unclassified Paenibacillus TaxID=185978 RepID=UPI0029EEF7BB|nr:hypothetical protein [Paenibacillus sp.]
MKHKLAVVGMAVLGGIVGGFVLSSFIGAIGFVVFGKAVGIKYLPVILPIVCAAVAVIYTGKKNGGRTHGQ